MSDPRYVKWLQSRDTGISSETMFSVLTGIPVKEHGIPYDMGDVGRCVRMLRQLPDLRPRIGEMIRFSKAWMPFIDCWKELEQGYDACVAFEALTKEEQKKASKRKYFVSPNDRYYELMQKLVFTSRYLTGLRCQGYSNGMSTTPLTDF